MYGGVPEFHQRRAGVEWAALCALGAPALGGEKRSKICILFICYSVKNWENFILVILKILAHG